MPPPMRNALLVWATVLSGVLLLSAMALRLRQAEDMLIANEFRSDVAQRAESLEREVARSLDALYTLAVPFRMHDDVTQEMFSGVATGILARHGSVQALEWIPSVPASRRAAVESVRAESMPGFRFTERESQGLMRRAGDRATYFPVYFVEPLQGNEAALGFDLGSDATRRDALVEARRSGRIHASRNITLVQERQGDQGFLAFLPVYSGAPSTDEERAAALRGFVLGVFRISDIFRASALPQDAGMMLTLRDLATPGPPGVLYRQDPGKPLAPEHWGRRQALGNLAGREWSLAGMPTRECVDGRRSHTGPLFLVTGLLLAGAAGFAGISSRRHRRAARELEQRERELAHSMRLSTLGELVAGIAHEVNQPLAAIANFAGACTASLEAGTAKREQLLAWARDISTQATTCGSIIERIRDFSRKAEGKHVPFDLCPLIRESVDLAQLTVAPEHIVTTIGLGGGPAMVKANRVQIQQVLVNLLRNAYDAVDARPGLHEVSVGTTTSGDHIEVAVSDSGPGLDASVADQVFDAFYSTKRDGLGMGLAISRSIIEAHDGRLWFTPNKGQGVTFRFTLPLER